MYNVGDEEYREGDSVHVGAPAAYVGGNAPIPLCTVVVRTCVTTSIPSVACEL